jgi:bifunctional N-acetylglucosamine-1-phosphate-uridyltransferase/glucosamine-1-phosphate-acetyltransferase GlmU-like protein
MKNNTIVLILAAGKGSRLHHELPKPLVPIHKVPMINRIINAFKSLENIDIAIVVGYRKEEIMLSIDDDVIFISQDKPTGTADAVKHSIDKIKNYRDVLIVTGDSGLINKKSINTLIKSHFLIRADCSFLSSVFPLDLPYARVIRKNGSVIKCVEERDANETELESKELFTSHYLLNIESLLKYINKIQQNNKTGESYLTDIINIMIEDSCKVNGVLINDYRSLMGINTLEELELAESWIK